MSLATICDWIDYERVTSSDTLVSGVTRVPGSGVCPVTTGAMGCNAGISESPMELLTAVVTEAVFNPDAVMSAGGLGEGHSGEIGHGIGGCGRRHGVEKADAGRGYALRSGRGGLGEDELGRGGFGGEFGGGSHFEAAAANIDFSGARAEADDGRNLDELGTEAFGGLHPPAAADEGSGLGRLGDDASGGNHGGVEMIAAGQFEATLEGDTLGLGRRHATQVRHRDLAAMDGESHADQSRGERDDDEHENLGEQTEETNHRRIRVDACAGGDKLRSGNPGARRSRRAA